MISATKIMKFDTQGINCRYLSLLPSGLSQAEIARLRNVSQVTVHKWQHGDEQVSWKNYIMPFRSMASHGTG